jgi:hypothetical protein
MNLEIKSSPSRTALENEDEPRKGQIRGNGTAGREG